MLPIFVSILELAAVGEISFCPTSHLLKVTARFLAQSKRERRQSVGLLLRLHMHPLWQTTAGVLHVIEAHPTAVAKSPSKWIPKLSFSIRSLWRPFLLLGRCLRPQEERYT